LASVVQCSVACWRPRSRSFGRAALPAAAAGSGRARMGCSLSCSSRVVPIVPAVGRGLFEAVSDGLQEAIMAFVGADPTAELLDSRDRSQEMGICEKDDVEYPPDVVLSGIPPERYQEMLAKARRDPKCSDLDPFTRLLFGAAERLDQSFFARKVSSISPNDEEVMESPCGTLETEPFGPFLIPNFDQEVGISLIEDHQRWLNTTIGEWLLRRMQMFDETSPESISFFESNEEAALYFYETLRHHLPRHSKIVAALCRKKFVDGDASAIVFSGFGQWFLKATKCVDGVWTWADREASAGCMPPEATVAVVDLSGLAQYAVRPSYEKYGAAALFDRPRAVVGVGIEEEGRMYRPADATSERSASESYEDSVEDDWDFAVWRFKSSLVYQSFAVGGCAHRPHSPAGCVWRTCVDLTSHPWQSHTSHLTPGNLPHDHLPPGSLTAGHLAS